MKEDLLWKYKSYIVYFFFIIYFIVGCNIYRDYGISWDEPAGAIRVLSNIKYVDEVVRDRFGFSILTGVAPETLKHVPDLSVYPGKEYGVARALPLAFFEIWHRFTPSVKARTVV